MAKITNIGAVMIYANDPEMLARWYATHLGLGIAYNQSNKRYFGEVGERRGENAAPVIQFGIYPAESKLAAEHHAIMVNYEVDDFDGFLAQLRSKGVEVEEVVDEGWARFAYVTDPEGNRIEFWAEAKA